MELDLKDKIKKLPSILNLQGTTGIHENAICGTLTVDIYCLLKKKFEAGKCFGKSAITFLVCAPEVGLSKIILGSPWLKGVNADIRMHENGDRATARLFKEGGYHRCSLQLKQIKNLQITSCDKINNMDFQSDFEINSFLLNKVFSLQIHEKKGIRVPKFIRVQNEYDIINDRGFPFLYYNPKFTLPVASELRDKQVTISVSLVQDAMTETESGNVDYFAQHFSTAQSQTVSENSDHFSQTLTTAKGRPDASPDWPKVPLGEKSAKINLERIRDASTFLSLPDGAKDLIFPDSQISARAGDTVVSSSTVLPATAPAASSENKMCQNCHVYKNVCACGKICNVCKMSTSSYEECACDIQNVQALKAKIEAEVCDESDVVTTDQQTDISKIVNDKFEMFDLAPPEVTKKVDLSHIVDPEIKTLVESLLRSHQGAFSKHRFDVGHFELFEAELDCIPGSSVIEKERPMKPHVRDELKPIIDELLEAGIIRKATTQGPFLSNSHAVAKPVNNQVLVGKADLHILKQSGGDVNHSRLTLDLRPLNHNSITRPKINLPNYESLIPVFKNKNISTADLCSMYWSIHVTENTQHLSNFFYDHHVYSFCSLPQGWINSCFVGQSATEAAYGQDAMLEFLTFKGWKPGTDLWPWYEIRDAILIYMDDLCLYSDNTVPGHVALHGRLIEFLFWATKRAGFRIGANKFSPFVTSFKFLGHWFDGTRGSTAIPPARLEAIKNFRIPRSCAEMNSRLSILAYHRRYLLAMKLVAAPLQRMGMSGIYEWKEVHQKSWKALLLLAALELESHVIDTSRPLFLATDASQISIGWVLFQLVDGGVVVINLDFKLLKSCDRRRPAALRETLGMMYALISNEGVVKSHPKETILLTDCIGLSAILRSKNTNTKMLEYALYLSTFSSLHVRYTVGSSLFLADLISRQFNRVELCEDSAKISEVWSHFQPPIQKRHLGAQLTPEMLTDLLISNPQAEFVDCYPKRHYYDQQLSRYHTRNDEHLNALDPIPVEASFLASLYLGFNGTTLTAEQFKEMEESIRNTPAQALAKRVGNGNLNALRKSLFSLGIHDDLVAILKRKYFPDTFFTKKEIKAGDHLNELDLPQEIADIVRRAWKSAGFDPETKSTQLLRTSSAHSTGLAAGSADFVEAAAEDIALRTPSYRLGHESDNSDDNLSKFLENVESQGKVSDSELLSMFGVDEIQLREVLQPVAKIALQFFYFLSTGRLLENNEGATVLKTTIPQGDLDHIFSNKPVTLPTLLKLLVTIIDYLQNHPVFLFRNVIRVPFHFSINNYFEIQYDHKDCSFGIFLLQDLTLENYGSIRFPMDFSFLLDQLVEFETNPELAMIAISCQQQAPPYYHFSEIVIHSLIRESFSVAKGSKIGKWTILSLEKKSKFVPLKISGPILSKMAQKTQILKTFNARKNLADKLSSLLLMKKNDIQHTNEMGLHDTKSRQIYVSSLKEAAQVQEQFMPRDNNNRKKFPYTQLITQLNSIILSQFLIKNNMHIGPQEIIEIQESDNFLFEIRKQLRQEYGTKKVDGRFILHKGILFKSYTVLGQEVWKLALPEYLCSNILRTIHDSTKAHISRDNMVSQYNCNFYTKGVDEISRKVVQGCLHCMLNKRRRRLLVKGTQRTYQEDVCPGSVWVADCLYLPKSNSGHAYVLVLTERLTSYIAAMPLRTLNSHHVGEAFRTFLSIMPQCKVLVSDHGRGDFGSSFTQICEEHGIQHCGQIPNRSQVQASCEISNQLLANQLARICSSELGKKFWEKSLAKACQTLNSYRPYDIPFSKTQLLFSPFIYSGKSGHMNLSNPITAVRESFKFLNEKRIQNLTRRRGKTVEDEQFAPGQFVLINDENRIDEECQGKLSLPRQSRLYKVLEVHKNGFSCKLLDIQDGSKKEILCSRLSNLSLDRLQEFNFSSPTFYESLQKITDKLRNKYEPGTKFHGLRLLHHDDLGGGQHHQGVTALAPQVDPAADSNAEFTNVHTDHHIDQDGNNDGIREGHVPVDVHPIHDGIPGPNKEHVTGGDAHIVISNDEVPVTGDGLELKDLEEVPGRITRFRGRKHVPVFVTQVKNNKQKPGILRLSSYRFLDNFRIETMRIINNSTFTARKKALLNHYEICLEKTCPICNYFKSVEKFRHDSGNFSRYVQPTLTPNKSYDRPRPKKTVSFAASLFCSSENFESLPLDIGMLHSACVHNTSFRELRLLKRDC